MAQWKSAFEAARSSLAATTAALNAVTEDRNSLRSEAGRLRSELEGARDVTARAAAEFDVARQASAARLTAMLREGALREAEAVRRNMAAKHARLGKWVTVRTGANVYEAWEDGDDFVALERDVAALKARKEEVERMRREVARRNKKLRGGGGGGGGGESKQGRSRKGARGGGAAAAAAASAAGGESDDSDEEESGEGGTDVAASFLARSTLPSSLLTASAAAAAAVAAAGVAPPVAAAPTGSGGGGGGGVVGGALRADIFAELELVAAEEGLRSVQGAIKREEGELVERRRVLEAEKAVFVLDVKRWRAQVTSRWRDYPVLGAPPRYMLLDLLGKGGFSEVWRAVDLLDVREVAVKLHQLSPHWPEDKKKNYVRHALREYEIQQALVHPHVVRLHAVIEIDGDCFATVLEHCRGGDLEKLLKAQTTLPEREARAIISQVLSALRYLNGYVSPWAGDAAPAPGADGAAITASAAAASAAAAAAAATGAGTTAAPAPPPPMPAGAPAAAAAAATGGDGGGGGGAMMPPPPARRRIIHYDLKPANILFNDLRSVKVTDFGLSKIIDDGEGGGDRTSMELTSQGAGTYWYLPPECLSMDASARISSKVDVWSVGVIMFQMLYGRRPFGDGQSQEQMVQARTLAAATAIPFTPKPPVSAECKAFITRCLTHDVAKRPDVMGISEDPYLRLKM